MKLRLGYAFDGLLYSPLFVAKQLHLLPAYIEPEACTGDQDAHDRLAEGTIDLALCDPFVPNLLPGGQHLVVVDLLIGTTPLWVMSGIALDGCETPEEYFREYEANLVTRSKAGYQAAPRWHTLPQGTTAHCITLRCKDLIKNRQINPKPDSRQPANGAYTTPWAPADGDDICFTADPYEVALIKAGNGNAKVGLALGGHGEWKEFMFTGLIGLETTCKRRTELTGLWAALMAAREMLVSADPEAIDALATWYSFKGASLNKNTLSAAIDLLCGSGALSVDCWAPPHDRKLAFDNAVGAWKVDGSKSHRRVVGGSKKALEFGPTRAIKEVNESDLTKSLADGFREEGGERPFKRLTVLVSVTAGFLMSVAVLLSGRFPPNTTAWAVCIGSFCVLLWVFGVFRAKQTLKDIKRKRTLEPWAVSEAVFWLTLTSVVFGAFLEVRNSIASQKVIDPTPIVAQDTASAVPGVERDTMRESDRKTEARIR